MASIIIVTEKYGGFYISDREKMSYEVAEGVILVTWGIEWHKGLTYKALLKRRNSSHLQERPIIEQTPNSPQTMTWRLVIHAHKKTT